MAELPMFHAILLILAGAVVICALCVLCGCYMFNLKKYGKKLFNASRGYKVIIFKEPIKCLNISCPICMEDFKKKGTIAFCPCKHGYHIQCLSQWLKIKNTCPLCQQMPITQV